MKGNTLGSISVVACLALSSFAPAMAYSYNGHNWANHQWRQNLRNQQYATNPNAYNNYSYNTSAYNPAPINPGMYNPGMYSAGMYNPGMSGAGMYNPGLFSSGMNQSGMFGMASRLAMKSQNIERRLSMGNLSRGQSFRLQNELSNIQSRQGQLGLASAPAFLGGMRNRFRF